jgi:hypothetical protein
MIMNNVNRLFAISAIYVPIMMILMFYPQIDDFYTYTVPLNSLVIPDYLPENAKNFQEIQIYKDSECFTTLNGNLFCYSSPSFEDGPRAAYVIGENGIDGEIHFDPVNMGANYFLMLNKTKVSEDKTLITFADKGYKIGNDQHTSYEVTDDFEFTATVEKFDTFISHCTNYEGTSVTIVQYLGIRTMDGTDYFLTWHTSANSESGVVCNYPQIIQHSLGYNFRQL